MSEQVIARMREVNERLPVWWRVVHVEAGRVGQVVGPAQLYGDPANGEIRVPVIWPDSATWGEGFPYHGYVRPENLVLRHEWMRTHGQ